MDSTKLRDRLREIVKSSVPGSQAPAIQRSSIDHATPLAQHHGCLDEILCGEWRGQGRARCVVVTRRVSPDAVHGQTRVGDIAEALDRRASEALMLGVTPPVRPPLLFFDLETTGLNGGAGTYAFLVGCGSFSTDGSFVTTQYVLAAPAGEREMLLTIARELERAGALVSFNGRSFDAPLLETRYLFHRLDWGAGGLPHLDMLHQARRFWGAGDCSLTSLEGQVLGVSRSGDVPGFEIPARYFHFIRSADARPLRPVLEHNRLDLLSLAALTARVLHLIGAGPQAAVDAREALALGRVYSDAGHQGLAREALGRAVEMSANGEETLLRLAALRALARNERGWRCHTEAAISWRQILETPDCPVHFAREAAEALAIHHEHRVHDLRGAKEFALRSLMGDTPPARIDAGRHRLARIERKMERANAASERASFPSSSPPLLPSFDFPTSERQTSS